MDVHAIYDFFEILRKDDQCFIYSGDFSDEITEKIISLSENNLQSVSELSKLSNKVSFLMAECFQNIVRHSENHSDQMNNPELGGLFFTRNVNSTLYIASANLVPNKEVTGLRSKLENVNKLDKEELKMLYRHVLKNQEFSSKGGAGLGLIEMARKSDKKLDFDFEAFNREYSFFYLQILLQGRIPENGNGHFIPIEESKRLRKKITDNSVLMVHKGDFSQDSLIPILKMIENNLRKHFDKYKVKKRTYHLLVEILQNISRHSYKTQGAREAIFMVSKEEERFSINAGNYIRNDEIKELKEQLDYLNSLEEKQLSELYIKTLSQGKLSDKAGAGLGLIDIARESTEKLAYHFVPVDDKRSFYSLHVQI